MGTPPFRAKTKYFIMLPQFNIFAAGFKISRHPSQRQELLFNRLGTVDTIEKSLVNGGVVAAFFVAKNSHQHFGFRFKLGKFGFKTGYPMIYCEIEFRYIISPFAIILSHNWCGFLWSVDIIRQKNKYIDQKASARIDFADAFIFKVTNRRLIHNM